MSDRDLLRDFIRDGSQTAFARLVERHLGLVYSVARRRVRSPELAEEVAQSVFVDLAQQAGRIGSETPLVAWLHVVARRTAIDAVRREVRQSARDHRAAADPALMTDNAPSAPWSAVEPLLDEAVESLPPLDRTAILLRYFEEKPLREVGAALGCSEDAAQKRVTRALEQLKDFCLRRGVVVTATGLAGDISAHAVLTVSANLAPTITAAALGGAAVAAVPTLVSGLAIKVFMAAAALTVAGVVFFQARAGSNPATPPAGTRASPRARDGGLASAGPASAPATANPSGNAMPRSAEDRVALLRQLLAELPAQWIPEIKLLTAEHWRATALAHPLDSTADIRLALADLRALGRERLASQWMEALRRYTIVSGGALPAELSQLVPYLDATADAELLSRYEFIRDGDPAEGLIREKATSDMILSIGRERWRMKTNPEHPAAFGETDADALERTWRALGTTMDEESRKQMATLPSPRAFKEAVDGAIANMASTFGDEAAVGARVKEAYAKHLIAHPEAPAEHLGQLLPHLRDAEQFIAAARPFFAQMEFLRENPGQPPADPERLRPYLERPFDAATAFREAKLTWDGERLHLSFSYGWSSK